MRCLIYAALLAEKGGTAEDRQLGASTTLYWLGRVSAEFPDAKAVDLVPDAATRLETENIDSESDYCGAEAADHVADMERTQRILQELMQAAASEAK